VTKVSQLDDGGSSNNNNNKGWQNWILNQRSLNQETKRDLKIQVAVFWVVTPRSDVVRY
jgi:hypothetical protein